MNTLVCRINTKLSNTQVLKSSDSMTPLYFTNSEDPKKFMFRWVLSINIYPIRNINWEIRKTQEYTCTQSISLQSNHMTPHLPLKNSIGHLYQNESGKDKLYLSITYGSALHFFYPWKGLKHPQGPWTTPWELLHYLISLIISRCSHPCPWFLFIFVLCAQDT